MSVFDVRNNSNSVVSEIHFADKEDNILYNRISLSNPHKPIETINFLSSKILLILTSTETESLIENL